jgi:hypothetical protein
MSKKTKQVSTELNEDPFEKLEPHHQMAVEMRLENFAYKDIAAAVKKSEQTVKWWFMKGGICKEAYDHKKVQRAEDRDERYQEIAKQLDEMASDALLVLKRSMKKGSESAAIRVLELAGFTPVQKVKNETPQSEELDLLRKIVDKHEGTSQPLQGEREAN